MKGILIFESDRIWIWEAKGTKSLSNSSSQILSVGTGAHPERSAGNIWKNSGGIPWGMPFGFVSLGVTNSPSNKR